MTRTMKRLLACVLVTVLCLTACPWMDMMQVSATVQDFYPVPYYLAPESGGGDPGDSDPSTGTVPHPDTMVHNIVTALSFKSRFVDLRAYGMPTAEAAAIISDVIRQEPSLEGTFSYEVVYDCHKDTIVKLKFTYGTGLDSSEPLAVIDAEVNVRDEIMAYTQGMTDFDKAIYIHDYLVLNGQYDEELAELIEDGEGLTEELRTERYDKYALLVNGTGVCDTYAKAYEYLLLSCGIPCITVSSDAMNHSWNMVQLDGQWYHVDCTWDDPVKDRVGLTNYDYFLLIDEEITEKEHHSWVPDTNSATATTYSEMPRGDSNVVAYGDGYWCYYQDGFLYCTDRYGYNVRKITNYVFTALDIYNGYIYGVSGNLLYRLNISKPTEGLELIGCLREVPKTVYIDKNGLLEYYTSAGRSMETLDVNLCSAVKGISISFTDAVCKNGQPIDLKAIVHTADYDTDLFADRILWSSSDEAVATVDATGRVTPDLAGTVVITATLGEFQAQCTVTVEKWKHTNFGYFGNDLYWALDEDAKTLSVTGNGNIPDFASAADTPWAKYRKHIRSVVVDGTVTGVGKYAFAGFENLESILIPDSVLTIGEGALEGCCNLKSLTLPFVGSGRTANRSEDAVLGYIFGKADEGVVQYYNLADDRFAGYCYGIPSTLKNVTVTDAALIPFGAFFGCDRIESISLNEGIHFIDQYAFCGCQSIREFTVPTSVESVGESVLEGCNAIENLTLPFVGSSRTASNSYDAVLGYIFGRANSGVCQYHRIEDGSLYYNYYGIPESLTKVTLTDERILSMGAFHNCTNLKEITLNEGILSVGGYAFANTAITEILIPDSVEAIGEYALGDCNSLETLTIPFVGSSRDAAGTYDAVFGHIFGRAAAGTVQYYSLVNGGLSGYRYAIPSSVKNVTVTDDPSIALGAFSNCTTLSTVELKEATASIENCGFYGVKSLDKLIIQNEDCAIYNSSNCIGISGTMYGHVGSTAASFANRYGITYATVHNHTGGQATCSEAAKCDDCGAYYGQPDASSHSNVVVDAAVSATCTSVGLTEGSYCGDCGEILTRQNQTAMPPHAHQATVTAPTCTAPGYTTYTCAACADSYTGNSVPATGHGYVNGVCTTCGEKDPDYVVVPTLTLKYPSLSFEDEILYNVYYGIDNTTSVVEMGLITFDTRLANGTIGEAVDVIPGFVNSGATYMVQSNGIPAKNLSDAVFFKVYAKLSDGSYVYTDIAGYHAVAYANTVLNNASSSAKAKALVVAMLNYGAAAQEYFGYKSDAPMNAGLTAEQQALIQAYDPSMVQNVVKADASKVGSFKMNGGYSNIYPTVSFEGAFSINFYFVPNKTVDTAPVMYYWDAATYGSVDVLTPENATGVLPMNQDGSNWGAAIEGIAAKALDDTIYVAGYYTSNGVAYPTSVIAYSLGNYCKTIAANGTFFGAATAVYGFYAKAYFAS